MNNVHALKPNDGLPAWLDREAWADYSEWREEVRTRPTKEGKRYPWGPSQQKYALRNLERIVQETGQLQGDIIGQSIANGWVGLFPVR